MRYKINLKEPAAAGYQWLPVDSNQYLITSKTYVTPDQRGKIGGPADVEFEILPLTDKPFSVTLQLKRPFEDEIVETKTFNFNDI